MTNTIKKFLRLLSIVWGVALTVLVFAVLLLKIDLVMEIFSSPAVVAIVCIVLGISTGFIAGAIVCYLNTAKAVEARDKRIEKLKSDLANARNTIKALQQNQLPEKTNDGKLGDRIMSQIADLSTPSEEPQEEDFSDPNEDLQEEET